LAKSQTPPINPSFPLASQESGVRETSLSAKTARATTRSVVQDPIVESAGIEATVLTVGRAHHAKWAKTVRQEIAVSVAKVVTAVVEIVMAAEAEEMEIAAVAPSASVMRAMASHVSGTSL
jgi:hypothetical protein